MYFHRQTFFFFKKNPIDKINERVKKFYQYLKKFNIFIFKESEFKILSFYFCKLFTMKMENVIDIGRYL